MTEGELDELISNCPQLYHMAAPGSWQSIQRHGMLSTSALLDLYEVKGVQRRQIELEHRPDSIEIRHPIHGTAVVRDQKPMSDSALQKALGNSCTPTEWYKILNAMVFFWLTKERLSVMRNAKAYRNKRQDILTFDTRKIVDRNRGQVRFSSMNSGATKPFPWPRTPELFTAIEDYPYSHMVKKKGGKRRAVVEFCVLNKADIEGCVIDVIEGHEGPL